ILILDDIAFLAILTSSPKVPGALSEERHSSENINSRSPTPSPNPRPGWRAFEAHRVMLRIHYLSPEFQFSVFLLASSGRRLVACWLNTAPKSSPLKPAERCAVRNAGNGSRSPPTWKAIATKSESLSI